jgi:hypothetical protein
LRPEKVVGKRDAKGDDGGTTTIVVLAVACTSYLKDRKQEHR